VTTSAAIVATSDDLVVGRVGLKMKGNFVIFCNFGVIPPKLQFWYFCTQYMYSLANLTAEGHGTSTQ